VIFQIIVASFAMLFTPDFWRYSLWTLIPFIGFHLLFRWLLVHKTRIFAVSWFNLSYPFIALITIIPIVFVVLSFDSITRLLIDKDTEPLLGLILNGISYFYLNIIITIAAYVLFKIIVKTKTI
jgi:hypothetical protein